jgi:hypothetical protein
VIYAGSAYAPGESTAPRDARCAAHGGQDPSYERGSDTARFRSKVAKPGPMDTVRVRVACPDGPGPCRGEASGPGKGHRVNYDIAAGKSKRLSVPVGNAADRRRVRIRLRSLLGPGVEDVRRRLLTMKR